MSDKSPKKLDKLFRKGSEQYDFGYNAEAWEQMESLLDKDDRRRFFIWWWLGGLGVLLLAGSIWFFGKETTELAKSNSAGQKTEQSNLQNNQTNLNRENQQSPSLPNNKSQAVSEPAPNEEDTLPNTINGVDNTQPSKTKTLDSYAPKGSTKTTEKRNTPTKEIIKPPPIADAGLENKTEKGDGLTNEGANQLILQTHDGLDSLATFDKKINVDKQGLSKLPVLPLALLEHPSTILTASDFAATNIFEEETVDHKKENTLFQNNNALLIGLVAAGELTSVGMGDFSKTSWKIGGQIEYRYRTKYSTTLGANFIRKRYMAGSGEYIPPIGFWTNGIAPKSSSGICNILEVPITVGYFPKGYSSDGFYMSAGLTSYFMLWEWYGYYYNPPDPELISEWQTSNGSNHWFGISQFSVGYNKVLNRRISLQFEPYLQIPLTGVGHGNVKLWSFGFSMKANLRVK